MSRKVVISYSGFTIESQAKCDAAIHSLCRIDKTLNRIKDQASKFRTDEVVKYEKYLLHSKEVITNKINDFKEFLEQYKNKTTIGYEEYESGELVKFKEQINSKLNDLDKLVNELTGSKLSVIDEMIQNGLLNVGQKLLDEIHGVKEFDQQLLNKINSIEDVSLRDLTYQEMIKPENKSLSFNVLLEKAQNKYQELLNGATDKVIEEYKEELSQKGISKDVLNNVKTIDEASKITNAAIVGEQVRKETLKVIIKSIKDRGFIVDTKHNLKIDRDKNIVKLVALKASGQKAEFEISLDGKFMYHFDNYEGHACKKDIEPFLEDLHNIYDINVLHEEVIWENPDKIQTQKYQYVNKNKGTN